MPTRPKAKPPASTDPARNSVAEWAGIILLLLFGTTSLCQAYVIPTGSMEDNLVVGDHLLVDKLAFAPAGAISRFLLPYETPKHGDIIVFRNPVDPDETLVKRLIGVPGDRIRMTNGVLYRNGSRVNEPYVFHKYAYNPALDNFPGNSYLPAKKDADLQAQAEMLRDHVRGGELIVPAGAFFAMGDNRDNSYDSRYWGLVPAENVIGKPFLIYWSYRASTEDLVGQDTGSMLHHFADLAQYLFSNTRWERTGKIIRGFPDSELPNSPVPLQRGNPNP